MILKVFGNNNLGKLVHWVNLQVFESWIAGAWENIKNTMVLCTWMCLATITRNDWLTEIILQVFALWLLGLGRIFKISIFHEPKRVWKQSPEKLAHWTNLASCCTMNSRAWEKIKANVCVYLDGFANNRQKKSGSLSWICKFLYYEIRAWEHMKNKFCFRKPKGVWKQ